MANTTNLITPGVLAAKSPAATARESTEGIVVAFALAFIFRAFIVEAYRIPSGSMVPTLLIGDWLFVNKMVYGPHIPFTKWNLPGYSNPKVGEVAVFESPYQADEADSGRDPTPTLVKRIQGGPGDTLYMRNGMLYRNGEQRPLPRGIVADTGRADPTETNPLFDWQRKYALAQSRFGAAPATPNHDNWGPLVIPAGYYFMMGDARYDSKDSRYWGIVPRKNFRGRPLFVYYSYNADDSDRFAPAITDIRWSRIGTWIR